MIGIMLALMWIGEPVPVIVTGDLDGDNDVDLVDYSIFQNNFMGPLSDE